MQDTGQICWRDKLLILEDNRGEDGVRQATRRLIPETVSLAPFKSTKLAQMPRDNTSIPMQN